MRTTWGNAGRSKSDKHQNLDQSVPKFSKARSKGEVVEKDGYHQPNTQRRADFRCGCSKTTDKGAYRDVIVEYEDLTIYFYHQHPVVVKTDEGDLSISSCGYHTRTTKQRINQHLPSGFRVYQEDFEWYLSTPEETRDFKDGMTVGKEKRVVLEL